MKVFWNNSLNGSTEVTDPKKYLIWGQARQCFSFMHLKEVSLPKPLCPSLILNWFIAKYYRINENGDLLLKWRQLVEFSWKHSFPEQLKGQGIMDLRFCLPIVHATANHTVIKILKRYSLWPINSQLCRSGIHNIVLISVFSISYILLSYT